MKKIAESYYQYDQKFLSLTLDHETIFKNSTVLIYGETEYGYQREINDLHLRRMCVTLEKTEDAFSPTSILLGVSPEDISKCLTPFEVKGEGEYFLFDTEKIESFKFRIIDGQHRIKALHEVKNSSKITERRLEQLEAYQFNVIIAIIPENKRIDEVEMFRTINSKAKPLKTDLAMLAKYKYEVMYQETDINVEEHIRARIIFLLNDEELYESESCWKNGIKVDVNNSRSLGTIGFKAFNDSIDRTVSWYFKEEMDIHDTEDFDSINEYLDKHSKILLDDLIVPSWKYIQKKWPYAFMENTHYLNDEVYTTYYNKDYYIQQTMGVKAIHGLLYEIYSKNSNLEDTLVRFEEIIKKSLLTDNDWKKGGTMKGLSSEAGFKIIRERIKNNEISRG